jgi:hypothetical protein
MNFPVEGLHQRGRRSRARRSNRMTRASSSWTRSLISSCNCVSSMTWIRPHSARTSTRAPSSVKGASPCLTGAGVATEEWRACGGRWETKSMGPPPTSGTAKARARGDRDRACMFSSRRGDLCVCACVR